MEALRSGRAGLWGSAAAPDASFGELNQACPLAAAPHSLAWKVNFSNLAAKRCGGGVRWGLAMEGSAWARAVRGGILSAQPRRCWGGSGTKEEAIKVKSREGRASARRVLLFFCRESSPVAAVFKAALSSACARGGL